MKNFQDAVTAIAQALPLWEQTELTKKQIEVLNAVQKNLNEAQTCQAVILRLLDAAGYDIWNPFEVFPEKNGRGENARIPDFTIFFETKGKFVIEAKALSKKLIDSAKKQAVDYANSLYLRWAILTNGKQWIFLDNEKAKLEADAIEANATEVALVLNLLEPREGEFLGILLNRELWEAEGANERVAEKVQLIRLAMEVSKILHSKKGIKHNQEGVEIAIDYLPPTEDKKVAMNNLPQIVELLFPKNSPLVETSVAPIVVSMPKQSSTSVDTWQLLAQYLRSAQAKSKGDISKRKSFYSVKFGDEHIVFSTMPLLYEAVAETCVQLKCDTKLNLVREDERNLVTYPKCSYRQLSNNQYVFVHFSFNESIRRIKPLLEALAFPEGSVTISSNDDIKELP